MKMVKKVILIEDVSDCQTCTERQRQEWEMLREVRVAVLEDVTCQECGRTINLLVEEDR